MGVLDPGLDAQRRGLFGGQFREEDDAGAHVESRTRKSGDFDPILITVPAEGAPGAKPVQLCERNPRRLSLWITNNSTARLAISRRKNVSFQATAGANPGQILPANSLTIIDDTFDELWCIAEGGAGSAEVRVTDLVE